MPWCASHPRPLPRSASSSVIPFRPADALSPSCHGIQSVCSAFLTRVNQRRRSGAGRRRSLLQIHIHQSQAGKGAAAAHRTGPLCPCIVRSVPASFGVLLAGRYTICYTGKGNGTARQPPREGFRPPGASYRAVFKPLTGSSRTFRIGHSATARTGPAASWPPSAAAPPAARRVRRAERRTGKIPSLARQACGAEKHDAPATVPPFPDSLCAGPGAAGCTFLAPMR